METTLSHPPDTADPRVGSSTPDVNGSASQPKWWKNYPLLVSVLAFVLSLTTALLSAYLNYRKGIHDQQSELSASIQALQDLYFKGLEVRGKYTGQELVVAQDFISAQINSTLATASGLALRLGTDATSSQLTTVGLNLVRYTGDTQTSQKLFELGIATARSAAEESAALRDLGWLKFRNAKSDQALQEGERLFLRALSIEQRYDLSQSPETLAWFKATALIDWAAYLAPHNCDDARKHFAEGVKILNDYSYVVALNGYRDSAQTQEKFGIGGLATCQRTPDTAVVRIEGTPGPAVPATLPRAAPNPQTRQTQ
jgi:hypothetical protein